MNEISQNLFSSEIRMSKICFKEQTTRNISQKDMRFGILITLFASVIILNISATKLYFVLANFNRLDPKDFAIA